MKASTFTQLSFSFSINITGSTIQITLGKIIKAVTQLLKYCLKSNNTQTISRFLSSLETVKNQINQSSMLQIVPPPPPTSLLNATKKSVKIQVINRITNARQDNISNRGTDDNYIYKYKHTETHFTSKSAHRSLQSFTIFYPVQIKSSLGNRLSL